MNDFVFKAGSPVYGDFFTMKKQQAEAFSASPLALVPYVGGYYDRATGNFYPVKRKEPTPS